jgi:hypothetical protein
MIGRLKAIAAALFLIASLSATSAMAQAGSEDNTGVRSEDNMGVMTEDGVRTTQPPRGGQSNIGGSAGAGSAGRGGPGSGSAAAEGITNDLFGAALAKEPLVPAAQNPLLGRWRSIGADAGTDLSAIGPLGEMSTGLLAGGCQSMFGRMVVFGPSTFERVTPDGHTQVLHNVEYHGRGATIAVLARGTGVQPTVLRLSDLNHATSALGCVLQRDTTSAGASGVRLASASAPRLAAGEAYLRTTIGASGPGGFNPLANAHVWITREDPAAALAKAGYPGASRGSSATILAANCGTPIACNRIFYQIGGSAIQTFKPGPDGLGSSEPLAAGSYYVIAIAPYQAKAIVWAVPIALRPGANSLKLDQNNGRIVR